MQELDELTILKAARHDRRAFSRLYEHYAPFVWRLVYRMVNTSTESAGDVHQQVFLKVYQALPKFSFGSTFSTWVYRITFNTAMSALSAEKNTNAMVEFDESIMMTHRTSQRDTLELTQEILSTLTPEERFLLTGQAIEGLTFEECAEIIGKSPGALRTQVSRLKERIRRSFEQDTRLAGAIS